MIAKAFLFDFGRLCVDLIQRINFRRWNGCDAHYGPLDHQSYHRKEIQLEEDLMTADAWL